MADPQIRYAKTSDGVTIAYYTMGSGPPLLLVDFPSNLLAEWKIQQQLLEFAAGFFTLICYDARGFGLSDRTVADFTVDGMVRDIEAVIDAVGVEAVRVVALGGFTAPVGVTFAARHPDRVTHLVLFWGAPGTPPGVHEGIEALLAHPNADWRFVTESFTRLSQGWDDPDASREGAGLLRESISEDGFKTFVSQSARWDVTSELASVTSPTLVVNPKDHPSFGAEAAAALAVGLRDARVVLMEGKSQTRRGEEFVAATMSFLLPEQTSGAGAAPVLPGATDATVVAKPERAGTAVSSGTAVILFTDIVDSTALTERLGDTRFRDASRALDAGLRAAIRDAGVVAVEGKLLGDGVLATFGSAAQAIDGARRCLALSAASELGLHIGLHAGDVIREDNNVYGGAVNIASRICGLSAPGEILVSDVVRGMARSSAGVEFEDRGEQEMKGVGEPVRVYAVRATGGA